MWVTSSEVRPFCDGPVDAVDQLERVSIVTDDLDETGAEELR